MNDGCFRRDMCLTSSRTVDLAADPVSHDRAAVSSALILSFLFASGEGKLPGSSASDTSH